jgi:hypothetical protein
VALTDAQYQYLLDNCADARANAQKYGRPKNVLDCGDANANPGDICMEGECENGKKLIMLCNNSNGCTVECYVPC